MRTVGVIERRRRRKALLQRLTTVAEEHHYASVEAMLRSMYIDHQMPVHEIRHVLHVGLKTLRSLFDEYGIPVRLSGNQSQLKVPTTPELVSDILRDGVPTVAKQLGMDPSSLHTKMRQVFSDGVPAPIRAPRPATNAAHPPPFEAPPSRPILGDVEPVVYVRNHRITEEDVKKCLRNLGDEALAQYELGDIPKDEAYEMTRVWMRGPWI